MAYIAYKGECPQCTEPEVYKLWKEAAYKSIPMYGFCTDCTPEYQAKMIIKKRCEHPETLFELDKDGWIGGTLRKVLE